MSNGLGRLRISTLLSVGLFLLVTVGYPYAILISTLFGLDTTTVTVPYRGLIFGVSILLIFCGRIRLFSFSKRPISLIILVILLLISFKAIFLHVGGYLDNKTILKWFFATLVPAIAFSSGYLHHNIKKCVRNFSYLLVPAIFCLFIIWMLGMASGARGGKYAFSIPGLNNNLLGVYTAFGVVLFSHWLLVSNYDKYEWRRLVVFILVLAFTVLTIITISSGAITYLVLFGLSVPFLYQNDVITRRGIIVVIALTCVVYVLFNFLLGNSYGMLLADVISVTKKVQVRVSLFRQAWTQFLENPLTGGVGTVVHPTLGTVTDPHNVLIESFARIGIIGGALTTGAVVYSTLKALSQIRDLAPIAPVSLFFLVVLVSKLFSGGMYRSPMLYNFLVAIATFKPVANIRATAQLRERAVYGP